MSPNKSPKTTNGDDQQALKVAKQRLMVVTPESGNEKTIEIDTCPFKETAIPTAQPYHITTRNQEVVISLNLPDRTRKAGAIFKLLDYQGDPAKKQAI